MAEDPLFKPEITEGESSAVAPRESTEEYADTGSAIESIGRALSYLVSGLERQKPEPVSEIVNSYQQGVSPSIPKPSIAEREPPEYPSPASIPDSPGASPVGDWVTPEIAAFLNTISAAEGTNSSKGYNIIVGLGKQGAPAYFSDFSKHPNIIGLRTSKGPSTAAGRYQIVGTTWRRLQKLYPELKDFSPANQDKAAWLLAQSDYKRKWGRDLGADLRNNVTQYLPSLKTTWEGFYYKDPIKLFTQFRGKTNAANK